MGNKNSQIDVKFERSYYFTNQPITGNISLDIKDDSEVSSVKLIYVTLRGRLVRTHKKGTSDAYLDIYESAPVTLATPQPPAITLNFKQGNYLWPFSIQLPEYLPPTFHTQAEHLMYFVEVIFKRACFRSDICDTRDITICPHVNLQHIPSIPFTFTGHKQNINGILLTGTLNKNSFLWVETIKCKLEIFNTKRLLIKNVDISVFYIIGPPKFTGIGGINNLTTNILQQTVTSIANTREEMISQVLDVKLPSLYSPPSFFSYFGPAKPYMGFSRTYNVTVSYTFKIVIKVEGILSDINITAPIMSGTVPRHAEQENQLSHSMHPRPTDDTNICDDNE